MTQNLMPFEMAQPNQDVNESEIWLHQIRFPNGLFIVDDQRWEPTDAVHDEAGEVVTPSDLVRPVLWDGWLMTCHLRESKEISETLDELYESKWDVWKRKILRARILKFFQANYKSIVDSERQEYKAKFYASNPSYDGLLVGYEPLTPQEFSKAARAFENALQLVSEWCMTDFSRRRHLWPANSSLTAPVIATCTPDMDAVLRDRLSIKLAKREQRPIKKTAKQLRAEQLAAMTTQQRTEFLKKEKLNALLKAAIRKGSVTDQDLIDMEIGG